MMNSSSCDDSLRPFDWFVIDRPQMVHFNSSTFLNRSWPWLHLGPDQYREIYTRSLTIAENLRLSRLILTRSFYIFGVLGNVFALSTILHIKRRCTPYFDIFFAILVAIFSCNLIFVVSNIARRHVRNSNVPSAVVFYCVASGSSSFASFMTDMLTMDLALDRLIGLAYARYYECEKRGFRRAVWAFLIGSSVLIALPRIHFGFKNFHYVSPVSNQGWFRSMVFYSDNVTPFLVAGIMIPTIVSIHVLLIRKYRRRPRPSLSRSSSSDDVQRKATQHFSIFNILVAMYFLGQIGLLIFGSMIFWWNDHELSFESTLSEIRYNVGVYIGFESVNLLGELMEALSRSIPFFLCCVASGMFRMHFIRVLGCVVESVLFPFWRCQRRQL